MAASAPGSAPRRVEWAEGRVSMREIKAERSRRSPWRLIVRAFQSLQSSFIAAAPLCVVPLGSQAVPAQDQGQGQDPELLLGQEVFDGLKAQAEIIESSPLYDQLLPIADAITRAAQPRYNLPFKFYRVHGAQPNAFATPGGNVHVVDSLLYFVKNT